MRRRVEEEHQQREDAWQREFEAQHTCQIGMMKKELQASIKIEVSQIASHQPVPIESALIQVLGARVSTKGSCAEPQAQGLAKDPSDVGVELMGLYVVDGDGTMLVAMGISLMQMTWLG